MLELMQQPKRRKKKMNENCMDSTHCLLEIRTQYIRTNVLAVPPRRGGLQRAAKPMAGSQASVVSIISSCVHKPHEWVTWGCQ